MHFFTVLKKLKINYLIAGLVALSSCSYEHPSKFTFNDSKKLKIVTLTPHLAEWVSELGFQDQIVGVSQSTEITHWKHQPTVISGYQKINREALLALNPTLILADSEVNQSEQIEQVKMFLNKSQKLIILHSQHLKDIQDSFLKLDEFLNGNTQKSEKLWSVFLETIQNLKKQNTNLTKRFLLQVGYDPIVVATQRSYLGELLESIGFVFSENLLTLSSTQSYLRLSVEGVLNLRPNTIIVLGLGEKDIRGQEEVNLWKAKKINSVYFFSNDLLKPTLKSADGLKKLMEHLKDEKVI